MSRLALLRSTVARLESVLAARQAPDEWPEPVTGSGCRPPMGTLVSRAGGGNPNHVPSGEHGGEFTSGPGGGGHGKHWAKRQRRRKRLKKLRAKHKAARREQLHRERSERKSLAREHAREHGRIDRQHLARLKGHEKTAPGRHAAVDREQAAKAERIKQGEAKAQKVEKRQAKEKAEFEKTAGGDKGHIGRANEKLYGQMREQLKAKGGTAAEHADLEKRIGEHRAKFADPAAGLRKAMEARHAAEKQKADAFKAKAPALKERLAKQTAAKHAGIDRTPEKLEAKHRAEKADAERRHQDERDEQREEHLQERGRIRVKQRRELESKGFKVKPREASRGFDERAGDPSRSVPEAGRLLGGLPSEGLVRGAARPGRFAPTRTAKASSAESILRHCLRRLGLTARFRSGQLTGRQRLRLLEAIREYGRAWMHHEAMELIGGHEEIARAMGPAARAGLGRFFDRARVFLRELIVAGAMALGGPGTLSADELADADAAAEVQARYLANFEREVNARPPAPLAERPPAGPPVIPPEPAPMSDAQFAARAEQYGTSAWHAAQNINRKAMNRRGVFVAERRVHWIALDRHPYCQTCIRESNKGWVPLGTLAEIGDSECGGGCDCYFEWKDAAGNIHVSPTGRHNPRGYGNAAKPRKTKLKRQPRPSPVPPAPHVQVAPVAPAAAPTMPPATIVGPWLDAKGNPIVYHYEEAE